jgi:hypothetical protein
LTKRGEATLIHARRFTELELVYFPQLLGTEHSMNCNWKNQPATCNRSIRWSMNQLVLSISPRMFFIWYHSL